MDRLDEALLRVDAIVTRLEVTTQSSLPGGIGAPAAGPSAEEWDAVTRRIDAALAKARAVHVVLD